MLCVKELSRKSRRQGLKEVKSAEQDFSYS